MGGSGIFFTKTPVLRTKQGRPFWVYAVLKFRRIIIKVGAVNKCCGLKRICHRATITVNDLFNRYRVTAINVTLGDTSRIDEWRIRPNEKKADKIAAFFCFAKEVHFLTNGKDRLEGKISSLF